MLKIHPSKAELESKGSERKFSPGDPEPSTVDGPEIPGLHGFPGDPLPHGAEHDWISNLADGEGRAG